MQKVFLKKKENKIIFLRAPLVCHCIYFFKQVGYKQHGVCIVWRMRTGNSFLVSVPNQELENGSWKLEKVFQLKRKWMITYWSVKLLATGQIKVKVKIKRTVGFSPVQQDQLETDVGSFCK